MTDIPRIGLLPLYLALYDERLPEMREVLAPFLKEVITGLQGQGVTVVRAPVCRLRSEVDDALEDLEREDVDLLVTLHLGYSPSLESAGALAACETPLALLDTTMDEDFGLDTDPQRILYNHGIHGVMDLACMLRRLGKAFQVVAGHYKSSDVLARTANLARAARAARAFRDMRTLRLGPTFPGMGDFAVDEQALHDVLGIRVDQCGLADLAPFVEQVREDDISKEIEAHRARFACEASDEVHRRGTRVGLGLRAMLEQGGHGAFSLNFMAFDTDAEPVNTVPFLEASLAMSRGIGYAGEGDVLTAALVGALAQAFGQTTFTEVFCPDWKGDALFLSHMGEVNPDIAAATPRLYEMNYPYSDALNPPIITCAPRPGAATLVNIAPGPNDTFDLIVSPVEIMGDGSHPGMRDWMRAWVKPTCPLPDYLERYSQLGGTHHSAMLLGDQARALTAFAAFVGLPVRVIGAS